MCNKTVYSSSIPSWKRNREAYILALLWFLAGSSVPAQATNQYGFSLETDTAALYDKINQLIEQSANSLYQSPIQAYESGLKAIYLAHQVPDDSYLIRALNKVGSAAYYAGYIGEAATYFTRSVGLLRQKPPSKMLAETYNNLGAIYYYGKGEADSAIAYSNMAIMLFQELRDPLNDSLYNLEISQGYSNIGHIFLSEKDFGQAERYFKMSLDVNLDTSVYQRGILTSLLGLAEIYLNSDRLENSYEFLDSAEQYVAHWEDNTLQPAIDYLRGQWHEIKGNNNKAIDYYRASIERSLADSTYTSIRELANALSDIYQKEGQEERALYYLQLAINAEQEIDKMSAAQELTKMEMQSKFSQWESEIQQTVKTTQQTYLYSSLLAVTIALIATWLLLIARKQKRKTQLRYLQSKMYHEQSKLEKAQLSQSMVDMEKKLAKQLLERVSRNKLIEETIQKLLELYRKPKLNLQRPLQEIANTLRNVQDHTIWEEFEFLYASSNSELFQKLNGIEGLTPNDRRLCIFLHMNMTSKEISALTGQSLKAIEVARTRLRKKLNLTNTNVSLTDFLLDLEGKSPVKSDYNA